MTAILLTIDTSSEACSVALQYGADTVFRFTDEPRKHAEWVLPMVDAVLVEAGLRLQQLDAIGFGCGPGSFTGLRIAAGSVQGLAYGADVPVVPVSSLATLAQRALRERGWHQVHAAFDARMGEVYWGSYCKGANGVMELIGQEVVSTPSRVQGAANVTAMPGWYGAGSGWKYVELLEPFATCLIESDTALLPHALDILPLAQYLFAQGCTVTAEQVAPVYLRNNVAMKSATAK